MIIYLYDITLGWREKLIDIDEDINSPYHFRVVLASCPTPASSFY